MNEEALKYAHELFTKDGYSGSLDDYKKLIETNKEALDYSYKLFKKDGYTDNFDTFQGLLGVKKKGAGERTIQEYGNGSKPSQVTQTKPKVFGESITTGVEGIKKTLAESKQPFEQPKTKQIEPQVGGELEWKTDLTPSKMTTKGIMIEEKKDGGADFGLSKYVEQQTINTISETMGYSPIDVRRKLTEAPLAERTQFLYSVNNAINQKVEDTPTLFIDAETGQYTQQRNKNKQIVAQLEKTKEYIGLELQKVKSEATKNINQFATINSQTEPNSYFNTFFNDGLQSLKATNPEQAKTIQNVLEKGIRLNDVYSYNAAYSGYISNINNIDKKINDLIKLVPTDEIKKKRDKIDTATNQQDYNTAVNEYNAFIAPYKNSIDELQKLSTLRDNVDGAWKNNYKTAFPEKYKLDEEQKLVNKEYEEGGIPTKAYYQLIAPIRAWLGETGESAVGFVGNSMSALGFIDKDLYINARKRFDLGITTNLQPEIIQGLSKLDNVQHREYILNKYGKDSLVYNQQTNEYEINKQSTNAKEVEEYVGTGVNWDAIVPTMIKTTAQSYGFYSGGLLFGGKSALAKNVAQFGSVFVQSMDMNVQQAIDNGMSFDDAMIIGAMYSTIEGLSERIVPEEKIWGGLSKLSGSKLNKFYDDALNLHRLGMKGNVKQFATSMADLSIGYVKSVAPEIGEEFISQIGQAVTDTVYNKVNDANKGDIEVSPLDYKTLKNIALETMVGMTPTALLGGVGNMSTMKKVAMYSMGKEPQVYKDALKDLLESGQITKEKYDKQVQKVDTVSNIYEMLPNETTSGIKLNDDAKIELLNKYYAKSQLTAEKKVLENAGATEEDVNVIDEQIKEKSSEIVSVISTGKIEENVVEDKNILYAPLKGTPITMGDVAALEKELEDSGKTLTAFEIGSKYNIGLIARQTIFDKYNNLKPKQYAVQKPTTTEEMLRPKSEGEIGQLGLQGVEQKDQSKDTSKASEAKEVAPLKIELSPFELTEEEISKLDNDQKEEYQFLVEANTPSSKDKLKDLVAQIRAEQPTVSKEQAPASRDVESTAKALETDSDGNFVPKKYTLNARGENPAPNIPVSAIDLQSSGLEDLTDVEQVKLLEIRGKNSEGKTVGKVWIKKQDGQSYDAEVFFNDAELKTKESLLSKEQTQKDSGAGDKGVPFIKKIFDKIRSITKLNKVQHNILFNIDTKLSKEIADAYEKMKHDPNNPKVKKAYKAMVEETKQQYDALIEGGLKAERWTGKGEPYANSKEMLSDLKENNHLWFLPNESAFGDKDAATKYKDNIGLQDSGITLDGKPLTNSEVFRIVHDAVHGINGNEFGAIGEENATLQHLSMYSDEALPAVVAQTRGQNSWVNFSGVNDSANAKFKEAAKLEKEGKYDEAKKIRKEAQKEFIFAEPKIGLLPNKYNFRYYGTKNSEIASKEGTNTRSGDGNKGESQPINALTDEKNLARESKSFSSRSNNRGRTIRTSYGDVVPKAIHTVKQSLIDGINKVFPNAAIDKELFEVDADIFHKAAIKAKSVNKYGAAVDILSPKEYSNYRLFITEDGLTGIALSPTGDLGSGFDMSGKSRRLVQLLVLGIENGATHANAFDTILPDYYSAFGFKPVARNLWNDALKPKDWNYTTFEKWNNGRPDVVHFVWDGGDRNNIYERIGQFDNYSEYHKEQTPVINTWEEAQEIVQQSLLSKEQAPEAKKESTPKKEKTKFAEDEKRKLQPQRARDRGRRIKVRRFAPLEGAPSVQGINGGDPQLIAVAEEYARKNGISLKRQSEYAKVDENRAKRIADEYEKMKHDPQNPKVKEAYENLIKQTIAQYEALTDAGYKFWFIDANIPSNAEYASTPYNALRDARQNKTMGVFPTTDGFGTNESIDVSDNPLMAETGFYWSVGGLDGKKKPVLANDLFRAVHDMFGHGLEGAGFRARGEENAWQAHIRLFTGSAIGAITSETRGQNSWLNYGPYGDTNRTAKVEDTVFADQKTGLMPEWTWAEGKVGDMEEDISQEEDIMQVFDDIAEIDNEMEGKNAKELKELKQERKDILNNNPQSKFIIEKLPELRKLLKFEQQGKCR
jgi:hypothetical protein